MSALDNSAIYRLKYTKEKMSEELDEKYKEIKLLTDTNNSSKFYREQLAQAVPPCIPFIGLLLTDLVFLEDGNQDIIDDRLINFHKRRLIIKSLLSYNQHQKVAYNFQRVQVIQDYLKKDIQFAELLKDEFLFELSLVIEPRGWDGISSLGNKNV